MKSKFDLLTFPIKHYRSYFSIDYVAVPLSICDNNKALWRYSYSGWMNEIKVQVSLG